MNYPLISEYVESIKLAEDNFAELTNLRPVLGEDGTPVMSSGNFAVVFKMQDTQTGKFHAVRCFHREQTGRAESYKLIEAELNKVASPYVVSFRYMERELFVDSKQTTETEFPVLLMDWVEGVTLDKYLREHIADKRALDMLTYHFSQLAVWLMPQPFAHGDLKPDNILVRPDGTPVLVDYDGMFVPAMQGQKARELGSPDFRHPQRTEDDFGERMDDFSLISILLSLKLIALHPEYFEEYGASDRLLFSAKDYADIANCQLLKNVFSSADAKLNRLASLFLLCHSTKDLANVSFMLLGVEKPKELSTEVTDEDLANVWGDEFGVKYSQDGRRLFKYALIKDFFTKHNLSTTNVKILRSEKCYKNTTEKILFINLEKKIDGQDFLVMSRRLANKVRENPNELKNAAVIKTEVGWGLISRTSFNIPEGTEIICNKAFMGCYFLCKITIPDSVTSIGNYAFWGCSSLQEITIPNSVIDIGENPFGGCCCKINNKSPHYTYENGILYTAAKDRIISCVTNDEVIILPDSVTTIGKLAFFSCSSLRKITIPRNTKEKFKKLLPEYKDKLVEQ